MNIPQQSDMPDLFYSICYIFILNLLLVNCKKSNRTLCSHQISSRAFCFHHHERSITAIAFSYLLHTFNQLIKTPFLPLICLDNCKKCRYRSRLLPLHTQILVNPNWVRCVYAGLKKYSTRNYRICLQ